MFCLVILEETLVQHHSQHGDELHWGVARGVKIMAGACWTIPGSLTIQVELTNLDVVESAPLAQLRSDWNGRGPIHFLQTSKLKAAIAD